MTTATLYHFIRHPFRYIGELFAIKQVPYFTFFDTSELILVSKKHPPPPLRQVILFWPCDHFIGHQTTSCVQMDTAFAKYG